MKDRVPTWARLKIIREFYRWLTLPLRKPHRVQVLQGRVNHDVRHARHLRPGLLLWLFLKTSMGEIWLSGSLLRVLSCLASFVIGSFPRPYEKWEIQPLLKNSSGHSFPSDMFFGDRISCVSVSCLPLGMCSHAPISSISPCSSSWRGSLSQRCPRRLGAGTSSGEDSFAGLNEQIESDLCLERGDSVYWKVDLE